MGLLSWISKMMDEANAANRQSILCAMALWPDHSWTENEIISSAAMSYKKLDWVMAGLLAEELVISDSGIPLTAMGYRPPGTHYTITLKGIQAAQQPQH